ncbi:DUF1554 domain-containing protein [Leptospira congkakensis]|uniref:DUF1554 domain-containing protein n=1 Tax=Leptospira congkakensis TaxID=2484932 RepID=A0A4Z1A7L3_9LEPT|nr:DUF1554 domain-containing protein [Leptospira congkakensis]TGL94298.1 DUF1554 domain-containing protein [Leptospira congkakensis]TGL95058.1 DUF1554 domain-containing protein [Leptospira congkakensis]
MFVTNSTAPTNAGVAGLDSHCANATNKPAGGGTYKAMVSDGTIRRACSTADCSGGTAEHINWVLKTNTEYRRGDGATIVGTTNANGIFNLPLTNNIYPTALSGSDGVVTRLNANWTSGLDFTDWSGTGNGMYGAYLNTDYKFYAEGSASVAGVTSFSAKAICVEQ